MKAIRLKTEFLNNPIGVGFENPLLTWNCDSGIKQTAYQIIAKCDGKVVWDSGKVDSDSMRACYPEKLCSRRRIEWFITLWDENGEMGETAEAFFEMGLSADCKNAQIQRNGSPELQPSGYRRWISSSDCKR